jgi:hypothetical protein
MQADHHHRVVKVSRREIATSVEATCSIHDKRRVNDGLSVVFEPRQITERSNDEVWLVGRSGLQTNGPRVVFYIGKTDLASRGRDGFG